MNSENKRFTIDECGNITDTVTNRTLYVENRYTECNYYVNLLNKLNDENEELKQQINDFELHYTENYREFNKDELYVKDTNTEIELKNGKMVITVFVPQINQYSKFNYYVTGRRGLIRVIE